MTQTTNVRLIFSPSRIAAHNSLTTGNFSDVVSTILIVKPDCSARSFPDNYTVPCTYCSGYYCQCSLSALYEDEDFRRQRGSTLGGPITTKTKRDREVDSRKWMNCHDECHPAFVTQDIFSPSVFIGTACVYVYNRQNRFSERLIHLHTHTYTHTHTH
jgi:hypothetical protein